MISRKERIRNYNATTIYSIHTFKKNNSLHSQQQKCGQVGEGAAGDAGDGIRRESSTMEMIRDQCVRGRERKVQHNDFKRRVEKKCFYDVKERKHEIAENLHLREESEKKKIKTSLN